jgi:hypothetical protein
MRKFLIPSKDASIYEAYPTNNAGLDEILEIGKVANANWQTPYYTASAARSLLSFDLPTTESVPATAKYFLNLKLANATEVKRNQKILIYQVSQSWDEGSGYFYQNIKNVNDGATWKQVTPTVSWSMEGGAFLTSSVSASITLNTYPIQDVRVDITNIIQPYVSLSRQSNFYGIGLQFPVSDELDKDNEGNVKFFSSQTHTIHQPSLEIAWNSQQFVTGTLTNIPNMNVKVTTADILQEYAKGDVARIYLTVRDEFPLRSFDSTLRYKNKYYLPSSSYYSILDGQANVTVIPFDAYSAINCDRNGSYIDLDTSPLYKGRYYTLKFKLESGSLSRTINTDIWFKIT